MAETQANKLRARTRDALGPKVRGSRGHHPVPCMAVQVLQLIQPPFFPSAQGVMPEPLGSEEECLPSAPHLTSYLYLHLLSPEQTSCLQLQLASFPFFWAQVAGEHMVPWTKVRSTSVI